MPCCLEFTEHQRSVFCVFSGQGVVSLRRYLNTERAFADLPSELPQRHTPVFTPLPNIPHLHNADGTFDDVEADAGDDEDGLDDGTEMVIDTQPLLNHNVGVQTGGDMVPPPPPPAPTQPTNENPFGYVGGHPPYVPQQVQFHNGLALLPPNPPPHVDVHQDEDDDMEFIMVGSANAGASTAALSGPRIGASAGPSNHQASAVGPGFLGSGASTAPTQRQTSPANHPPATPNNEHSARVEHHEDHSLSPDGPRNA